MAEILHSLQIDAPTESVFRSVSTPEGLNTWWTLTSSGRPALGERYEFGFGPQYHWLGTVTRFEEHKRIAWIMSKADDDWSGTEVGLELFPQQRGVRVEFHHTGWRAANLHFRISSFCWAEYLRLMRRNLEHGELVPYDLRVSV